MKFLTEYNWCRHRRSRYCSVDKGPILYPLGGISYPRFSIPYPSLYISTCSPKVDGVFGLIPLIADFLTCQTTFCPVKGSLKWPKKTNNYLISLGANHISHSQPYVLTVLCPRTAVSANFCLTTRSSSYFIRQRVNHSLGDETWCLFVDNATRHAWYKTRYKPRLAV